MKYARFLRFNRKKSHHSAGYACLQGVNVIDAKISDHHPIIHDGVLFWNIMMQGNIRSTGVGYNNAFGLIESNADYLARLAKIGQVIAEVLYRNPSITIISLCEGPIQAHHSEALLLSLKKFPCMARFIKEEGFHKTSDPGQHWGLLMLADTRYSVTKIRSDFIAEHPKLANRLQLWQLDEANEVKYLALAHFPFAGDEAKTEKEALSATGQGYCDLINTLIERYSNESFLFCGDFNFNPYLINQWQDRVLDKVAHHNSILLTLAGEGNERVTKTVTVDGVLLSVKEKQKYHSSRPEPELLSRLKIEYRFFQSYLKTVFVDLQQREHDKQLGLMPYRS